MSNKRLFISYAFEDDAFALQLSKLLTRRGAQVLLNSSARPREPWPHGFRDDILKSSALVLIVPLRSVSNRNSIWFEAGAAKALGKRVLAVLPPHKRPSRDLPTDLADLLVLDTDARPLESVADTLVQAA